MDNREANILVEDIADDIVVVRLNRPSRLNALTREMVGEFNAVLDEIAANETLRAVILTGSGRDRKSVV